MNIEEINSNFSKACGMLREALPSVEQASAALNAFAAVMPSTRSAMAAFGSLSLELQRIEARQRALRYQLKRKGRPGWKHLRR